MLYHDESMRVVAYNIVEFEKELLARANAKVHDLTLISNGLNLSTIHYAEGKEVVIVSERDRVDKGILDALLRIGVKKIITRSITLAHIDVLYASVIKMHVANTPSPNKTPENIAKQTILSLNDWENNRCLGSACYCSFNCGFKNNINKRV